MPIRLRSLALLTALLVLAWGGCSSEPPPPEPEPIHKLRVAAAADLKFALPDLDAAFLAAHPNVKLEPTFVSSGTLYEYIVNGNAYDVFLSADKGYPDKLIEAKLADKQDEFVYAIGQLAIWVPNSSKLDIDKLGIKVVESPGIKKIAIANPAYAPYGRAAVAALEKAGLYEAVKPKLVMGDNVATAAQMIVTGNAEVGIISLSLAVSTSMRHKGHHVVLPLDAYPPIEQTGIILSRSQEQELAREYRDYLLSPPARTMLEKTGYHLPPEVKKP